MVIKLVDQVHHKIRKPTYRDFLKDKDVLIKDRVFDRKSPKILQIEDPTKGRIIDVRV